MILATSSRDYGIIDTYAAPNLLLLDIDGTEIDWPEIDRRLELMQLICCSKEYRETARGFHVKIVLDREYPPPYLVAIQAILGSDPRREALNFMRAVSLSALESERVVTCQEEIDFLRMRWQVLFSKKLNEGEV